VRNQICFLGVFILLFILFINRAEGQEYLPIIEDSTLTYKQKVEAVEKIYSHKSKGKHSGYKQFERWKHRAKGRLDNNGYVISQSTMTKSLDQFRKKEKHLKSIPQAHNWQPLGPVSTTRTTSWSSHIGRITSLSVAEQDHQHIIVGAPEGGVWKSLNGGIDWYPIFDNQSFLEISCVEINPNNANHYIIGTFGGGAYQSLDGGATWNRIWSIFSSTTVRRILFDPQRIDVIIMVGTHAVTDFYGDPAYGGRIFKSIDAGQSFTLKKTYSQPVFDIEFMPGNSDIVYVPAGHWLVRSLDNGDTWTSSYSGSDVAMIAVCPAAPANVYMLKEEDGGLEQLSISIDTGRTFSIVIHSSSMKNLLGYALDQNGGQAPRDMDIVVDPINPDVIVVGGIDTYKSVDRGLTWSKTTSRNHDDPEPFIHADVDIMRYVGDRLYFGTDGGLFYSDDGITSVVDLSNGLNIRQFYRLGVSALVASKLVAGSQDNGGSLRDGSLWVDYVGADGMECYVSKHDPNLLIQTTQRGGLWFSQDNGNTLDTIYGTYNTYNPWLTPLHEGTQTSTIYHGRRISIFKSSDLGQTWSEITIPAQSGTLIDFDIAESDELILCAARGAELMRTTDGGDNWSDISPPGEYTAINRVTIHPTDANKILVACSGYPGAFSSNDAGLTWDTLHYNLPYAGINQLIFENNQDAGIFAATTVGVFYLGQGEERWVSESRNMPAVDVRELEIQFDTIYAATYGRGIWAAPIENIGEIYGCRDVNAHNFNPQATYDNGTCETCSDFIINGGERWYDCGSVCNNNCSWEVYFNVDGSFYGTLRAADSLSVAGDTILFKNWLVNDTIRVAMPAIEIENDLYWKSEGGVEIRISNADAQLQSPLFSVENNLMIDGLILEGIENGEVILKLSDDATLGIQSGGMGQRAVIVRKE